MCSQHGMYCSGRFIPVSYTHLYYSTYDIGTLLHNNESYLEGTIDSKYDDVVQRKELLASKKISDIDYSYEIQKKEMCIRDRCVCTFTAFGKRDSKHFRM